MSKAGRWATVRWDACDGSWLLVTGYRATASAWWYPTWAQAIERAVFWTSRC